MNQHPKEITLLTTLKVKFNLDINTEKKHPSVYQGLQGNP
jgi:hypothetical protein